MCSDASSPSHGVRRKERFERLQHAVDSLSPEYREVILLARIKGMRLAEIAKRMGRSPCKWHIPTRSSVSLSRACDRGGTESACSNRPKLHVG